MKTVYENHYMHCGVEWTDEWDCTCNDECPVCHGEIEPYYSDEYETTEVQYGTDYKHVGAIWHVDKATWVPEGGWPEGMEGLT